MINLLKEKYTADKKRGFTLIELIVVMAIIAVLVLLAAPKFMGQTEKAQVRNIQNDVRVAEMKVSEALIDGTDVWDDWPDRKSFDGLKGLAKDGKLYGLGGPLVESEIENGDYRVLPKTFIEQEVRSRLEGTFYANENGTVYYERGVARQGDANKKEPVYSDEKIEDLVKKHKYIPVATAEELNNIRNNDNEERIYGKDTKWEGEYEGGLDKHYVQVANIDLSGYDGWNPIGKADFSEGWTPNPIRRFTGAYDGGNYVITGLVVKGGSENYQGLFGDTEGATFSNIGLIDNKVTANQYNIYVGGLVGETNSSTTISNSYATGSVTGYDYVGGLVGKAIESTTISNSYARGLVAGTNEVGGLVGLVEDSTINNSYWDKKTTKQTTSAGQDESFGKTTEEMKNQITYSGWNYTNIWEITPGNYPTLR